jgi:hypothetical protein
MKNGDVSPTVSDDDVPPALRPFIDVLLNEDLGGNRTADRLFTVKTRTSETQNIKNRNGT